MGLLTCADPDRHRSRRGQLWSTVHIFLLERCSRSIHTFFEQYTAYQMLIGIWYPLYDLRLCPEKSGKLSELQFTPE